MLLHMIKKVAWMALAFFFFLMLMYALVEIMCPPAPQLIMLGPGCICG